MFDWLRFLDSHNVLYVTKGPSVTAGHVAVHCPMCGPADKSQHMSIALDGRGWRCWRNPDEHKGKSPVALIAALLGCPYDEAARIAGFETRHAPDLKNFADVIKALMEPPKERPKPISSIELPKTFRPFNFYTPPMFVNYLNSRDYFNLAKLSECYGMRYATSGEFKGRIIFPVIIDGRVVTWTGRSVYPRAFSRYKSLTADPAKAREYNLPCALEPISNYLLWNDLIIKGGDTLILAEGPFDALRLNELGASRGLRATCYFGMRPSTAQINVLHFMRPKYRRAIILSDKNAEAQGFKLGAELAALNFEWLPLPKGVKDPGELTQKTLDSLLLELAPI